MMIPHCGILMIRLFYVFCKLNQVRFSDRQWSYWESGKMEPWDQSCPVCGAKGCMDLFDNYDRYLVSWEDGRAVSRVVTVERRQCASCGHTHAVLPSCLIPYKSYSLRFILIVLRSYLLRVCPIEQLCERYGISISTLYRWLKLFKQPKALFLGVLEDARMSCLSFLEGLSGAFLKDFYQLFWFSFLEVLPSRDKDLPSGTGACKGSAT